MAEDKNYTLRNLKGDDLLLMVGIINKIGFKELKTCFNTPEVMKAIASAANGEEANVSAVGVTVMFEITSLILAHLQDCRTEIYTLLANLSGKTFEEIVDLDLIPLTKMIKEVIKKEDFKDFFGEVFGLLK